MATGIGIRTKLNLPYVQAVQKAIEALRIEGFGVLTQIDMQATLKKKLDVDFRPYMILSACNPSLAYRAISTNLDIGVLLPCNIIIYQEDDGSTVSVTDPMETLGALKEDSVAYEVAVETRARLQRVIASLKRSSWPVVPER